MNNILDFFDINMNSNLNLLDSNYNKIVQEIRNSNLDRKNKNFIIFFIKEKYNFIYDKLKNHQDNDLLIWENIDNC